MKRLRNLYNTLLIHPKRLTVKDCIELLDTNLISINELKKMKMTIDERIKYARMSLAIANVQISDYMIELFLGIEDLIKEKKGEVSLKDCIHLQFETAKRHGYGDNPPTIRMNNGKPFNRKDRHPITNELLETE